MIEQSIRELLDVLLRWVHLIAGIMWIGNSLLFNWLDRNLVRDANGGERHVGRIWLLHSGGFYDVEKKFLAPSEMPPVLHWFKWQSYTTWMTGIALLVLLYWTGGATLMIDPSVDAPHAGRGHRTSASASCSAGYVVYDGAVAAAGALRAASRSRCRWRCVAGVVWALTHVLSGRAAFLHVGAMLGTCMAGNVCDAHHPVAAEARRRHRGGTRPGPARLGAREAAVDPQQLHDVPAALHDAEQPLLRSCTAAATAGCCSAIFFVGGALVRHWLNIRFTFRAVAPGARRDGVRDRRAVGFFVVRPAGGQPAGPSGPPVAYASVRFVLDQRCAPCHSEHPTLVSNPPAPAVVRFDTPEEVTMWRERILARAVVTRTMPLNNRTGMTDEERDTLARWITQGAPTQ